MAEPCQIHAGEVAVMGVDTRVADSAEPCAVEPGATFRFDFAPPEPMRRFMPELVTPPPAAVAAPEVAPAAAVPAPVVAPPVPPASEVATTASTTAEPAIPSADELTKVMGAAGGGPMGLVALVILVVGGAAGGKFWTKMSEQKHEQKMKQLEIDATAQGLNGAQPIPCQTVTKVQADAIAKLNAQIEELSARLAKAERKSASLSADFDPEELEAKVTKLEKEIKTLKAAKAKVGT